MSKFAYFCTFLKQKSKISQKTRVNLKKSRLYLDSATLKYPKTVKTFWVQKCILTSVIQNE